MVERVFVVMEMYGRTLHDLLDGSKPECVATQASSLTHAEEISFEFVML